MAQKRRGTTFSKGKIKKVKHYAVALTNAIRKARARRPYGVGSNTRYAGQIGEGIYIYKFLPDASGDKTKRDARKMRKITAGAVKLHKTPRKRTKKSKR